MILNACLYSSVFKSFLKKHWVTFWWTSLGKEFQSQGTTMEKALSLVMFCWKCAPPLWQFFIVARMHDGCLKGNTCGRCESWVQSTNAGNTELPKFILCFLALQSRCYWWEQKMKARPWKDATHGYHKALKISLEDLEFSNRVDAISTFWILPQMKLKCCLGRADCIDWVVDWWLLTWFTRKLLQSSGIWRSWVRGEQTRRLSSYG